MTIEQRLKGTMTVVAKIESEELVDGMFGGNNFAIGGTNPFACISRITSVAVIQSPEGDEVGNISNLLTGEEITKVMEVRNRLISSMAVDHIVMVDTVHGEQDIGMSNGRVVSRTIAELVFWRRTLQRARPSRTWVSRGSRGVTKGGKYRCWNLQYKHGKHGGERR